MALVRSAPTHITINRDTTSVRWFRVTSTPDQAFIYVDNVYSGVTTGCIYDVLAVSPTVLITKPGYAKASSGATVYNNQQTDVGFTLVQQFGSIDVNSTPGGAGVYVDGLYKGVISNTTGLLSNVNTSVGTHTVFVQKLGYAPFTNNSVTVTYNNATRVEAVLDNTDAIVLSIRESAKSTKSSKKVIHTFPRRRSLTRTLSARPRSP